MQPGGAKVGSMIQASRALAESKRNRLAGMSCSPHAISGRTDIQQAFQMLFNEKTEDQLKNEATWAAGRMDADESGDAVDGLKRKMRASMAQRGGKHDDWDSLFARYDRDGSGELDCQEFIKAVRKENGVTMAMMDNGALARLFRHIDVDGGGSICAEEFKDFIAWKPKLVSCCLPVHIV